MNPKFTKIILYGYLIIFAIISISSLGYYLDSLNPTVIQVCRNGCDDNASLTKPQIQERIDKIFGYCEKEELMRKGLLKTPDGSDMTLTAIGLFYENATHHLDNNTCEWKIKNEN